MYSKVVEGKELWHIPHAVIYIFDLLGKRNPEIRAVSFTWDSTQETLVKAYIHHMGLGRDYICISHTHFHPSQSHSHSTSSTERGSTPLQRIFIVIRSSSLINLSVFTFNTSCCASSCNTSSTRYASDGLELVQLVKITYAFSVRISGCLYTYSTWIQFADTSTTASDWVHFKLNSKLARTAVNSRALEIWWLDIIHKTFFTREFISLV